MTSIRNLPLAARLGGAFGVLVPGADHRRLHRRARHVRPARQDRRARRAPPACRAAARRHADACQGQRQPDRAAPLCARRRPGRAGRDHAGHRGQLGQEHGRRRQARQAVRRHAAPSDEYADLPPSPRRHASSCRSRSLSASRAETLRNAEDRATSRDAFEKQVLELDTTWRPPARRSPPPPTSSPPRACAAAHAADAGGTRMIIGLSLAAILAAIALAIWVTRSVVEPGQGARQPPHEPQRALPDRPRRRPRRRRRR